MTEDSMPLADPLATSGDEDFLRSAQGWAWQGFPSAVDAGKRLASTADQRAPVEGQLKGGWQ